MRVFVLAQTLTGVILLRWTSMVAYHNSVFWVLRRLPAKMFGELKKSLFFGSNFWSRGSCLQTRPNKKNLAWIKVTRAFYFWDQG